MIPASTPSPKFAGALRLRLGVDTAPDMDTLVKALNDAPANEQCRWLEAAIRWFESLPLQDLGEAEQEYKALALV